MTIGQSLVLIVCENNAITIPRVSMLVQHHFCGVAFAPNSKYIFKSHRSELHATYDCNRHIFYPMNETLNLQQIRENIWQDATIFQHLVFFPVVTTLAIEGSGNQMFLLAYMTHQNFIYLDSISHFPHTERIKQFLCLIKWAAI